MNKLIYLLVIVPLGIIVLSSSASIFPFFAFIHTFIELHLAITPIDCFILTITTLFLLWLLFSSLQVLVFIGSFPTIKRELIRYMWHCVEGFHTKVKKTPKRLSSDISFGLSWLTMWIQICLCAYPGQFTRPFKTKKFKHMNYIILNIAIWVQAPNLLTHST